MDYLRKLAFTPNGWRNTKCTAKRLCKVAWRRKPASPCYVGKRHGSRLKEALRLFETQTLKFALDGDADFGAKAFSTNVWLLPRWAKMSLAVRFCDSDRRMNSIASLTTGDE